MPLRNVVVRFIFSSALQIWYVEEQISWSILESPLEFDITRIDHIFTWNEFFLTKGIENFLISTQKSMLRYSLEGACWVKWRLMSTHNLRFCKEIEKMYLVPPPPPLLSSRALTWFQSQILEVYNKKLSHEERRFQNISAHIRNQHYSALRQWRATKRFFTGERGAWAERYSSFGILINPFWISAMILLMSLFIIAMNFQFMDFIDV